jgi:signal transduction histidine kinase
VRGLRHPYEWGRDHPLIVDGSIAVGLAVLGLSIEGAQPPTEDYRDPDLLGAALTVASTLPLVLRRRHPLATYLAISLPAFAYLALEYGGGGPFLGLLVGLYAVAAHVGRRPAVYCLAGTLLFMGVGFVIESDDVTAADVVGIIGVFLSSWVLGDNMRVRRAYVVAVEDRAAQLEREQDAQAQRAVLEERSRIARELHDVVAHSMSVMVVQAGAARLTLDRDPDQAVEAIGQIESTGRSALNEMRRLVGVLRGGGGPDGADDPASRLPQPGIDQLAGLVQQCRDAGLEVSLQVYGRQRSLPSGIELVVYRIVQEALTNTMQHAGPARAEVALHFDEDAISLSVVDDGRGAAANGGGPAGRDGGPGHGLAGMRERVALYGGEVTAGPQLGGGFRVWVEIPLVETGTAAGRARTAGAAGAAGPARATGVDGSAT